MLASLLLQIILPLGPEVALPKVWGSSNQSTPSIEDGQVIDFQGSRTWQVLPTQVEVSGDTFSTNQQDDPILVEGMTARSWRHNAVGGMEVHARIADLSLPSFDVFELPTTAWQPDVCKRPGLDEWIVAATIEWNEEAALRVIDQDGPISPVLIVNPPSGGSNNWTTVTENEVAIWAAWRRHDGVEWPNLWGAEVDPITFTVTSAYPMLTATEDVGNQNWPMIRTSSRDGLGLVYEHEASEIRLALYRPTGGRFGGTIYVGPGRDPMLEPLSKGWWAVVWRDTPDIWIAVLDQFGTVIDAEMANETSAGPHPGTLTDRPWADWQDDTLSVVWTDTDGTLKDIKRRDFQVSIP